MDRRTSQLALAASVLAFGSLIGCDPPPEPPGNPSLVMSSNPLSITSNGALAAITVLAKDGTNDAGTGVVTLSAAAGNLAGGGRTAAVTLGAGGTATWNFSCDRAQDQGCSASSVRIDGAWTVNGSTVSSFVNVGLTQPQGGNDGGTDGGTGGTDGGTDGGTSGTGSLIVTASKSPIYSGVGDYSLITATLFSGADGGGGTVPGVPITFGTNRGILGPGDGGTSTGTSYTESTSGSGRATAFLYSATASAGAAIVTAQNASGTVTGSVQVNISTIGSIAHVSTACGSQLPCNLMGIRGSGKNEIATITFVVTDTASQPVAGVPVTFSLGSGAPLGATVSAGNTTNAQGQVQATLQSGSGIGVVSVTATVQGTSVSAPSPGIGITGARVSNAGISVLCDQVNIPAYISATPPRDITLNCSVRLTDRYTNAIGFPTTVNFVAEAGTVSTSVITTPFNPGNPSDPNIGRANFTFSTRGGTGRAFPVDVTPLAANPTQDPNPRLAEPSIPSGSLTLNPRDGLLTLVAYVNGEEYFYDANGNGVYDSGEQFYDQGERLVDANDSAAWELGENFFDENNDGIWNGPDGAWQVDKQIWTEFHLLYTDLAVNARLVPSPFSGGCGSGSEVLRGNSVDLSIFLSDRNLNIPSGGTSISIAHTATKGSVRLNGGTTLLDGYGFGIERVLLNPATSLLCQPGDPLCHFRLQFYGWSGGLLGTTATVVGAPTTDSSPCQPDTATVTATELTIPIGASSSGALQ